MIAGKPLTVAAVGVRPGEYDGILDELPAGGLFDLVAFSDEGLERVRPVSYPVQRYPDYNKLLGCEELELILVDGPVELRRDFAVRAANAGKHVVVSRPFAETFADAYHMARTARKRNVLITSRMPNRNEPLYRKLRAAVADGTVGEPFSVEYRVLKEGKTDKLPHDGLIEHYAADMIDQVLLLLTTEIKDVRAYVRETAEGMDFHFRIEMSLRNGGWATVEMMLVDYSCDIPRWTVTAEQGSLISQSGKLVSFASGETREISGTSPPGDFWLDVYEHVRQDRPSDIYPRHIVRAFRVKEAALQSIEEDIPVAV